MYFMSVSWPLVALFAASTAACFLVASGGVELRNPGSRRGLRWLLVTAGAWGALQTGVLLATDGTVAVAIYTLSLLVGFATVGPWLYFCSAYTGHDYHHRPLYRRLAVGTYLAVVSVKLTNPIHGWYFAAEFRTEPVRMLAIDQAAFYWLSFALAYGLTGVGFVLLYRLYRDSERAPWTFLALFAVTGLTVVPKIGTFVRPDLVPPFSYEPVGVAAFAIGAAYVAKDTLRREERATMRALIDRTAGAIMVLDEDGVVRDHNERAAGMFAAIGGDGDEPVRIEDVSERIAAEYREGRPTLVDAETVDGVGRRCVVTSEPLCVGDRTFGYALLVQDVTVLEDQRERIKRHERQLNDMAGAIAHELRNSVTIAEGYLDVATEQLDDDAASEVRGSVGVARDRLDRVEQVVEDLHTLVRHTRDAGDPTYLDFESAIGGADEATPDAPTVVVEGSGAVLAAPTRFKQLVKNALRFTAYNGATTVGFTLHDDGFTVTDDGRYDAEGCGDLLFEYESAEPRADAGMSLPNVRALARIEGWSVAPDGAYDGGIKYRVRDVRVRLEGGASHGDDPAEDGGFSVDDPLEGEGSNVDDRLEDEGEGSDGFGGPTAGS